MKSRLISVVILSGVILFSAAIVFYKTNDKGYNLPEKTCNITLEGYIKKDTSGPIPKLVFISLDHSIYNPLIESSNCTLSENSHVEICANSIDTTDSIHKTIHINKVVFLP